MKLVYTFGRYNPPTKGHIEHFRAVAKIADDVQADYHVYISPTHDHTRNPITSADRIAYIRKAIPDIRISTAQDMFTIITNIATLNHFDEMLYVAGQDYFDDVDGQQMFVRLQTHAWRNKIDLKVQSSGSRTEGISGTKLRQAVTTNDYDAFVRASPLGVGSIGEVDVDVMFNKVAKGMKQ